MKKEKFYLGIDLGTSAVKGILRSPSGLSIKAKRAYSSDGPPAWLDAVKDLVYELNGELQKNYGSEIAALAISSQVGTYIIDGKETISWRSSIGKEELDYIKSKITDEEFISSIGMKHPSLISYPLPRLLYIQKHYSENAQVLMPKELLIRALTGETVTDVFSMRGIADPRSMRYADGIIKKLEIKTKLPPLKKPTDLAGYVTPKAAEVFGLKIGTPVYLGCNDFFAGLLGMGIYGVGDAFDLSGTSEHIGYISEDLNENGFVSGGYFTGNCTYGGTKSSGASCDLAIKSFGLDGIDPQDILPKKPPIFLPYLNGERAPIFDENARGVYFGLNDKTDTRDLAYATLEGVTFSLYDIATSMNAPKPTRLICGGGSARDPVMNLLRATLFDCETVSVCENDTSALGACILAMVGNGEYTDIPSAINSCVKYLPPVKPLPSIKEALVGRFEIYKTLYKDLKQSFESFAR